MRKMKFTLFLVLLFACVLSFSVFAENEVPEEGTSVQEEPQTEPQQETPAPVSAEVCVCGRPIYSEDGQGYSKYDCTKCRQNYLLCQCDCWCGAETEAAGEAGGQSRICAGCGKICPECDCADKEMLLKREKQIASGELSPLGLQRPSSAAAISVTTLCMIAALYFAVTSSIGGVSVRRKAADEKQQPESSLAKSSRKKAEGRSPIPVDISLLPALDAYEAAEEWLNRSICKRQDLLTDLGAEKLSAGQFAELRALSGLEPNEKCPVTTDAPRQSLPRRFCDEDRLTEAGEHAARAILTPETICFAAKRGEPGYRICLCGDSALILSDEGRVTENLEIKQIAAFLRKGLCDFSAHEVKPRESYSETLSKNTFTALMSLYLTGQTRFGQTAIEKIAKASGCEPAQLKKYLEKLEKKGLTEHKEGEYCLTLKAKNLLPEPGDDTVVFRTDSQRVLFVNKTDCVLCIHEQIGGFFILSCDRIPWSAYLDGRISARTQNPEPAST